MSLGRCPEQTLVEAHPGASFAGTYGAEASWEFHEQHRTQRQRWHDEIRPDNFWDRDDFGGRLFRVPHPRRARKAIGTPCRKPGGSIMPHFRKSTTDLAVYFGTVFILAAIIATGAVIGS